MKHKEVLVLSAVAAMLLVLAYALTRASADAGPGPAQVPAPRARAPLVYPRDRPRLPDGALATAQAEPAPERKARLDMMQRALLGGGRDGALFIEANAIRHAPLMDKILRCREAEAGTGLWELKQELGIDLTEDLDRVGFDGDVFVASGYFENLKIPRELGEGSPYGDAARLWIAGDTGGESVVLAKLGNGMVLSADSEDKVKAAIDRAEGRAGSDESMMLPPGFRLGEIYGTVGPAFIQALVESAEDPVVRSAAKLVSSSLVRMNVHEDAALSLDLQSPDAAAAQDLASMIEAGLTVVRAQAAQEGDADIAALLEQARVARAGDGRVNLDLAVPGSVLLKAMGCDAEGARLPVSAGPQAPTRRSGP